jgi:hypothetical protein
MLKIYEAEILEFNKYVNNELEAYSEALKLPLISNTLPAMASECTEYVLEGEVIFMFHDPQTCHKPHHNCPISDYKDFNTACLGTYIIAHKLGIGELVINYLLPYGVKSSYLQRFIIKSTQETLQIESRPQTKIVDMVAKKLQELRGDFIDSLIIKNKYKEHLNKLKVYEKLIQLYASLTGNSIDVAYIQRYDEYFSSAKSIEKTLLSPKDFFINKGIWFIDDNSTIELAYTNWYSGNSSVYDEVASSLRASLNFTHQLLKNTVEYNNIQKPGFTDNETAQDTSTTYEMLRKIKSYFSAIEDSEARLRNDFSKDNPNGLEKFNKFFMAAKDQVVATEVESCSPNAKELETLFCNVFCADKHLKFGVSWYREAVFQDTALVKINGALEKLIGHEVICEC